MKLYIGSDHAGFSLKEELRAYLSKKYEIIDCGTYGPESVDYPDYAKAVCENLLKESDAMGILVCYTGIGMSMTANKFKGIRAGLVGKVEDAILTREHNNANVLCLSAKNTPAEEAKEIVDAFLSSTFLGGRHERRVNKITAVENEN